MTKVVIEIRPKVNSLEAKLVDFLRKSIRDRGKGIA